VGLWEGLCTLHGFLRRKQKGIGKNKKMGGGTGKSLKRHIAREDGTVSNEKWVANSQQKEGTK